MSESETNDLTQVKIYHLLGADGQPYDSTTPGQLGGNRKLKIYGRLDCWSAKAAIPKGYAAVRVFFADEATAIAAGYRPCGHCRRKRTRVGARVACPAVLTSRGCSHPTARSDSHTP